MLGEPIPCRDEKAGSLRPPAFGTGNDAIAENCRDSVTRRRYESPAQRFVLF
jgi:hypothetical protein